MGNMLPCLVHARTTLPTMSSKHRSHYIKVLTRTLHNIKRCRCNKPKVIRETSASDNQSKPMSSLAAPRRARKKQGVVRFKVVLPRKDAARLLSLTSHGGRTISQVLSELRSMESGLANAATTAWRPVLESIPEEWY